MEQKLLLSATFIAASFFVTAQQASKTYAITGKADNNFFWADIKQVDIATGKITKTLFESGKTVFKTTNADKTPLAGKAINNNPTGAGVAACAFDARHNRLYFATMHFSDIRYLDLDKPGADFTTIRQNAIALKSATGYQPEENHITRMVIAADGFGYALTNDANHLIRFSTSKNAGVEDLGNLTDADANKGISIHNKCTGWGGDMVADAFGKMVLVSANRNVFTIDVKSRIALLTGTISGLPANFTTNGAAVDDDGNLVVSSANVFEGLYKVNIKSLAATKVPTSEAAFNASDLANSNFLSQKEANDMVRFNFVKPVAVAADAKVYPNPLTGSQFNVLFSDQPSGKYTIILTDIAGRALQQKVVSISKTNQVESIRLAGKAARGMYLVKVLSDKKELAFSERVVIQ